MITCLAEIFPAEIKTRRNKNDVIMLLDKIINDICTSQLSSHSATKIFLEVVNDNLHS